MFEQPLSSKGLQRLFVFVYYGLKSLVRMIKKSALLRNPTETGIISFACETLFAGLYELRKRKEEK